MAEELFKITHWARTPSVYELDAAHALHEDQPAFEQIQLHALTRGDTGARLRQRWRSFLQRFRKLKPKQTLVDHQPVWVPLLDLFVPAAGKASITYQQSDSTQFDSEFKILGSGFGGSLTTKLSETHGFTAEGIGKSYQMKILLTAIRYVSDEDDDQVRLEPELLPGSPEYRIVDLPTQAVPPILDSPQWQILHRVNLASANRGTYTWQRDTIDEASWKVDVGIPIPEALGIKLSLTLKITRSAAFSVKYEVPYGNEYIFYQPHGEILLAPFCAVRPGLT